MTSTHKHGVRFADGRWLERYRFDGGAAEPVTTSNPRKARTFASKEDADAHLKWTTWEPDEATVEPLP